MEQDVILSIRGQQIIEDEEPTVTELVTEGTLSRSGAGYTLRYQESALTGMEGTLTTVQVEPRRVTLLREGRFHSHMVFEKGRRCLSMYDTPYGALPIGIDTRRMKVRLGETGGDIEVHYAVEIGHAVAEENSFQISVKSRSGRVLPQ